MKIFVQAKPKSQKEEIQKFGEAHFVVKVKEAPIRGEANQAILKAIARYFNIPQSEVKIIAGRASRNKIIEVNPVRTGASPR